MRAQFTKTATILIYSMQFYKGAQSCSVMLIFVTLFLYLPSADVWHTLTKWPLTNVHQFEGITSYLDEIVQHSTQSSERERGREENNIAELNRHL